MRSRSQDGIIKARDGATSLETSGRIRAQNLGISGKWTRWGANKYTSGRAREESGSLKERSLFSEPRKTCGGLASTSKKPL